jgi:hypothetical protein
MLKAGSECAYQWRNMSQLLKRGDKASGLCRLSRFESKGERVTHPLRFATSL